MSCAAPAWSAKLIGHWPLDTGLRDALGTHVGSGHGQVSVVPAAKVGAGALRCGGANGDYVKVDADASLDSDSFSLLYWVKADSKIESSNGGMCRRMVGFDDFAFETDWNVHSPTDFEINWWNGSWHKGFRAPAKDTWIHLAWTYDAGCRLLALHVDGDLAALEPNVTLDRKGKALYMGGQYKGTQNFRGWLDDVRLYDGALTTAQIGAVIADPEGDLPPLPEPGESLRFDFETGDLQGWRVLEGEFAKLLNDREFFRNRRDVPFNKQGKYFLDTVEQGHDPQTGIVESPVFSLSGPAMSLLIGGGKHANTYLAICTLEGKEVVKTQGINDEILQRVELSVPQLVGHKVFLRIVDQNKGGWGHVTFDDFTAQGQIDPKATEENYAKAELRIAKRKLERRLDEVNLAALRAAIEDLTDAFGERYPNGEKYLARLTEYEQHVAPADDVRSGDDPKAIEELAASLDDIVAFQREALTANPLVTGQPLLFVVRPQYRSDHHNTATLFQKGEINEKSFVGGGALKVIEFGVGGRGIPEGGRGSRRAALAGDAARQEPRPPDGAEIRTLLDVPNGIARDPEVHFSGKRIVFSMRHDKDDDYHVYEIDAAGGEPRQLTFAEGVSDIDPLYLADGSIAFSSTREPKYCMCNRHIMANLFRMNGDGTNIHQIGKSTLFEGHGSLTPDGRILYDRWEYVDRNFGDAQGLWTVNPDGTNHALFWGNNTWSPGAVLDARVIPGTDQTICVFSSCHDRPWGALALIDPRRGLEGREPVVQAWPASSMDLVIEDGAKAGRNGYGFDSYKKVNPKYEDPYPLFDAKTGAGAGKYFLCSRMTGIGEQMGIYLVDVFGNEVLLHVEDPGCFDPMPLAPRPRPAVMPPRRDFNDGVGYFYVHDVYEGTHMEGVERGTVKSIRVVESPEKRFWTHPAWGGQGTIAPAMNWHDFNNKRILGTAPVEDDGSAYFAVPADKFVFFQLLDENGMMVQSMRSGTMVQSGERTGCIGCHDSRHLAPPAPQENPVLEQLRDSPADDPGAGPVGTAVLRAMRRSPSELRPWYGETRLFSYTKEVQPVFDRYCVRCHDFGKPGAKKVVLAGDRDQVFNASYNELWRKKYVAAIGAGPSSIQPALSWGSHASKLVEVIRKGHNGVRLDPESFDRLVTWIDLNAPYYPTYASAYPSNLAGRSPLDGKQLNRLAELTGVPFGNLANHSSNRGPQISFDRPQLSPCLAKLRDTAKYDEALSIIEAGKRMLAQRPRGDMEGFVACEVDQTRQTKYALRQAEETRSREAIRGGATARDAEVE